MIKFLLEKSNYFMIKVAVVLIFILGFFQTNVKVENENHNFLFPSPKRTLYVFNKDNIAKMADVTMLKNVEQKPIKIYVKMPTNIKAKEEILILNKLEELERKILPKDKLRLQTNVFYYKLLTINDWEIILSN